jgi:Fe2+ transport system protein FeoA
MNEQRLSSDAAFYASVSMIKRLLEMGLITGTECARILEISARHYGTNLIVYVS